MKESSSNSAGGKAIKVSPEELTFESVYLNHLQVQQIQMKNSLSAPVEINLKSSNLERFDIEPKNRKLAPFETFTVDVMVKVLKPLAAKTPKHREQIFIKSDFFDQKVSVVLIPAPNMHLGPPPSLLNSGLSEGLGGNQHSRQTSKGRDHSSSSTGRATGTQFQFNKSAKQQQLANQSQSLERTNSFDRSATQGQNFMDGSNGELYANYLKQNNDQQADSSLNPGFQGTQSSPKFKSLRSQGSQRQTGHLSFGGNGGSGHNTMVLGQLERELQELQETNLELNQQVRRQGFEIQNLNSKLEEETEKRQELEKERGLRSAGSPFSSENEQLIAHFKQLLREREPNLEQLMDLTLQREREQQERKDSKILEILKIKDKQMEETQGKVMHSEAEFGKLAQAFQELKRVLRSQEDKFNELMGEKSQLEERANELQQQLESFSKGKEYRRTLDMEEQLSKANDYIQTCQHELLKCQTDLAEKSQVEGFFDEAMSRYKEQLKQQDIQMGKLQAEAQMEKELRLREQDRLQSALDQMNQLHNSSMQERDMQTQFLKQERDYMERINQLQKEKSQLAEELQDSKMEMQSEREILREVAERIDEALHSESKSKKHKFKSSKGQNQTSALQEKVEEVLHLYRDQLDQISTLSDQCKATSQQLQDLNSHNQLLSDERDDLLEQTQSKKVRTQGRGVQTQIELEDMQAIQGSREKLEKAYEECNGLQKYCFDLKAKTQELEVELQDKNQELVLVMRSQQMNLKGSVSTLSDLNQSHLHSSSQMQEQSYEELVSRLNSNITQMKLNEDKLLQELTSLKAQLQVKSKGQQSLAQSSVMSSQVQQAIAYEERLSELEMVVLEQRQELLRLAEENTQLKTQVREVNSQQRREREEHEMRISNLNELNEKQKQINQLMSSQQSENGLFGGGTMSNKSTAVETERMRQHVQTLELNQMQLRHQLEEVKTSLHSSESQTKTLKEQLLTSEQLVSRLRYDLQVAKALTNEGLVSFGANRSSQLSQDECDAEGVESNRFLQKMVDQRNQIKRLQGLLLRAKSDMDRMKMHLQQLSTTKIADTNGLTKLSSLGNPEEMLRLNEKLRREQQQAVMAIVDLREEYTAKLMILNDKNEQSLSKQRQELQAALRRSEHLQTQLSYMEKKEMRLFSQLEEARSLQLSEQKERDSRIKDLESLLASREDAMSELEREVKARERTLQERQEQVALLIGTLENEHSAEESRQRVLNMTAELCSVKALHAQSERRFTEAAHALKKTELQNAKLTRDLSSMSQKLALAQELASKHEIQIEQLTLRNDEQRLKIEDGSRELNESKFREERMEMQLQLKAETIEQMKEQLKRQETLFKEEVERVRKDFSARIINLAPANQTLNVSMMMKASANNPANNETLMLQGQSSSKAIQFKTALSQLHLVVCEFLSQGQNQSSHYWQISENESDQTTHQAIIKEFEKTVQIAATYIEKLMQDLDKAQRVQVLFVCEEKAATSNKILTSRNEELQIKHSKMHQLLIQREEQRELYIKESSLSHQRLLKESELRLQMLSKENDELESQLSKLKEQHQRVSDLKDELEQSVFMFSQEQQTRQSAIEKRLELTVDERFKSKHEQIKAYFDSNIARILLNSQSTLDQKAIDFGREIVSLQLVIRTLQSQVDTQISELVALDSVLAHYKQLSTDQEQKHRDTLYQLQKLQGQLYQQDLKTKMELERKKQEVLNLEKDLLRTKDSVEAKTRELLLLKEEQSGYSQSRNVNYSTGQLRNKSINEASQMEVERLEQELQDKEYRTKLLAAQIEELQEKLVESRAQHISELEDLRVQYDLELAEQKRSLHKERENLERRFLPGQAPGDLMEHNSELQQRIGDLKSALDRLVQENCILRKKCESEKTYGEQSRSEVSTYKQALIDLESTMIEMTTVNQTQIREQMQQSMMMNKSQLQNQAPEERKKKPTAFGSSKKKANQLHFNREANNNSESEQYSQSKINHHDQSSLNVSALTSVNMIQVGQRPSSSMGGYSTQPQSSSVGSKQLISNPPQLIKALISAKLSEAIFKQRCEDLAHQEVSLRTQLKEYSLKYNEMQQLNANTSQRAGQCLRPLEGNSSQMNELEVEELKKRAIELEIENEDLKLLRSQEQVLVLQAQQQQALGQIKSSQSSKYDLHAQDFSTLIECVISLIDQLNSDATTSEVQEESRVIEKAQQLVIRSLAQKLLATSGMQLDSLNYVPSDDKDRKLWYLELLEQQVNSSEQVIQQLQNFIKKLQIDISGNLQSAAQIKAASMDLAQNTMKTSEEVKTLKHIVGLIKHDLSKQQFTAPEQHQATQSRVANPFEKQQSINLSQPLSLFQATLSASQVEQLQQKLDQLQNQLTVTEKVKKSLEQELVQLRLTHTQEVQSLSHKLEQTTDQRNSLLQTNEELHSRVDQLQTSLERLKQEIDQVQDSNVLSHTLVLEKEKEKQILAQNKQATSKHLQKLQQDMREWRAQTEENSRAREKQLQELQSQLTFLQTERDRLKSENQMLRRNEKDRKQGQSAEMARLEEDNKQLMERMTREAQERRKEIEFWVTERATMRQMIDHLENERVESTLLENQVSKDSCSSPMKARENKKLTKKEREEAEKKAKDLKKKLAQKLKQREVDLQQKEKQVQELRDDLSKLKISIIHLEQRLRESSFKQSETDERMKFLSSKLKEVELERDLILAERNNALASNDFTSQQIQTELNSLRECFAKLKVERDNLLYEMDAQGQREQEWRQSVEKVNSDMQAMERNVSDREREQADKIRVLETKNSALLSDIKYLKSENERMREKGRELDQSQMTFEQKAHSEQIKQQELAFQLEDQRRLQQDLRQLIGSKEAVIQDLHQSFLLLEAQKMREIQELRAKTEEVREANGQLIALYESQLLDLRQRFAQDKKRTEQQLDNMFSLAQRDAVVKNLKKELTTAKGKLQKSKQKNQALKLQMQNQENVNQMNSKPKRLQSQKSSMRQDQSTLLSSQAELYDQRILKLAQMLTAEENQGFKDLLDQMQKTNQVMLHAAEVQAEVEKITNWNLVISQQLQDEKEKRAELEDLVEQIRDKAASKENAKMLKSQNALSENIQKYKQEIKQLQAENDTLKEEWLSPQDSKQLQEKLRDLQLQLRTAKDEVTRKRDVVAQLKAQQNQTEVEATQILADLEGLKDDNYKLQKLIRENSKNAQQLKELKQANELLKVQEKRLREEAQQQEAKAKAAKTDLQRKEQLVREYKEKLESLCSDIELAQQKQNEIERLKEVGKKLKLEAEIKDNQVKALKQRLEHTEEELENLKTVTQSQSIMNVSQSSQLDSQIKSTKAKIKRYEVHLKKSLEAIKRIGRELSQQSSRFHLKSRDSNGKSSIKGGLGGKRSDSAMEISEFEKDFYKDSVNILGVSMDELQEFMNPSQTSVSAAGNQEAQQFMAKLERVGEIPELLNQDIDQICNYCVKLIHDINPDADLQ